MTLDYKNVLMKTRDIMEMYKNSDWMHNNSIVYDGEGLIASANFQSTVIKTDKKGNIKWLLADPVGYLPYWQQYILKPVGKDFEYPYNQHAVEVLPDYDNNPDTVDIILFDNGNSRYIVNKALQENIKLGKAVEPPRYSRLVHYRINEKKMTVEQIWQYGKERPELYSLFVGDADLLSNGNILGVFSNIRQTGGRKQDTKYIEVNKNKEVIWECVGTSKLLQNYYTAYRVERRPIYVDNSHELDLGKAANVLIPEEVKVKYGFTK